MSNRGSFCGGGASSVSESAGKWRHQFSSGDPLMYHVACQCGNRIEVRLSQAGSTVQCSACNGSMNVPNSSTLKRLAGDYDPHIGTLQRLAKAVQDAAPPFDGACQQCSVRPASIQVPVECEFLVKREMSDDGGIRPGITALGPSLDVVVGAAREHWRRVSFSLLFCDECHDEFNRRWNRSTAFSFAKGGVAWLLLAPVLLVLLVLAIFMPCVSAPAVLLVIIMAIRFRKRKRVHPFLLSKLQKLPLVGESLATEDEYQIRVGAARPFVSVNTH